MASDDIRASQAREHHRAALSEMEGAARHRRLRDSLIRKLREDDPQRWTYGAIAKAVGITPELVAKILVPRR